MTLWRKHTLRWFLSVPGVNRTHNSTEGFSKLSLSMCNSRSNSSTDLYRALSMREFLEFVFPSSLSQANNPPTPPSVERVWATVSEQGQLKLSASLSDSVGFGISSVSKQHKSHIFRKSDRDSLDFCFHVVDCWGCWRFLISCVF